MKPAVATCVHMRFVASVDQRPAIHRVDAHDNAEKIGALRDLENSRIPLAAFAFNPHLSCAGKNLASNKERQDTGNNPVPWDIASHQVIVMATVAVAGEISVVLVKPDLMVGW